MLRPYQQQAVDLLRQRHADRPLLCLPTGAGKTTVASEVIRLALQRGNRCIFMVHRRELVDQAVARLASFGIQAGRIIAGQTESRSLPVQVASIPSLIRRKHWPAELVIVDECAHATSTSWTKCLDRYADAWVIGLTATPIRLDGRGLGGIFGCLVEPVTTQDLVEQGHLVAPEVYAPPLDLSRIRKRAGEYTLPELLERMNPLTGSIVDTWFQRAFGQRTVVFAVNVEHSQRIVKAFQARGVAAEHIDGGTDVQQRADSLARLRSGETTLVSNCMVLSEGWDLPALQCGVLARPTKSLALFRQMVGRIMRPPGPVVCLDHAGCHHEHGLVTDPVDWSLDDCERRSVMTEPIRTCQECFAVVPVDAVECPQCGEPLAREARTNPPGVDNDGELVKFTRADKAEWYGVRVRMASELGYKLGWARAQYRNKHGTWPRFRSVEQEHYECRSHELVEQWYGPRRVFRCGHCCEERVLE